MFVLIDCYFKVVLVFTLIVRHLEGGHKQTIPDVVITIAKSCHPQIL